jgi:hypothetical protein
MIELLVTDDLVRIGFLRQALEAAEVFVFVTDSGPWNRPVRMMVPADDEALARRIVAEAEASLSDAG